MGTGSPPRVRGKAVLRVALCIGVGITPACAGKSFSLIHFLTICQDHPRVCGEKRRDALDYYYPQGSPPRVRGKAWLPDAPSLWFGITPACAGKSFPEQRGGHSGQGSPPRVRGKVRFGPALPAPTGITPACAGKSQPLLGNWNRSRDHPRVCGEKSLRRFDFRFRMGSPPRVRGKERQRIKR